MRAQVFQSVRQYQENNFGEKIKQQPTATQSNNGRTAFQDITNQQRQATVGPTQKMDVISRVLSVPQPTKQHEMVPPRDVKQFTESQLEVIELEQQIHHMEVIGEEELAQNPIAVQPAQQLENQQKRRGSDSRPALRQSLRQQKRRKSEEMDLLEGDEQSPKKQLWEDIDAADHGDPSMVSEYVNDIYAYLGSIEKTTRVNPKYMSMQTDITEKMRSILVDWMVEVHRMFKLLPETLFLTSAITDRYLAATVVEKEKLQLIGVAAMLIASKYEEIYAPEVSDFVYITDGAYDRDQILDMEEEILATLQFSVHFISPLHFLRRFSKAAQSDYQIHTLCKYIIEVSMIDIRFLRYLPSEIAVGATYLARAMTHQIPIWNPTLEHYSTYNEIHARDIAIELNKLLKRMQKSSLKSILAKYASPKCGEVANYPLIDL